MTDTIDYPTLYKEVQKMKADLADYRKLAEEDGKIDDTEHATLDTMMADLKKAEDKLETMICTYDPNAHQDTPKEEPTKEKHPPITALEGIEQWLKANWNDDWTASKAVQAVKKAINSILDEDTIQLIYQKIVAAKAKYQLSKLVTLDSEVYEEQMNKNEQEQLELAKPWLTEQITSRWSEDDAVKAIRAQYNAISEEAARKLVQEVVEETKIGLVPNGLGVQTGLLIACNGVSAYLNFPKLKYSFPAGIAKFTISASASGKLTFSVELQAGKKSYITIEAKGKVKFDKLASEKAASSAEFSSAGVFWHTISGAKAFDTPLGLADDLERKGDDLIKALSDYKKSPGDLGKAQKAILAAEALYKTMTNHAKLLEKSPNFTVGAEYLILKETLDNTDEETTNHVFGITFTWYY